MRLTCSESKVELIINDFDGLSCNLSMCYVSLIYFMREHQSSRDFTYFVLNVSQHKLLETRRPKYRLLFSHNPRHLPSRELFIVSLH